MNMTLIKWMAGALAAGGLLTGCATNTPRLDASFGEAAAMTKAQQTLNPAASSNTDPVAGLDGVAAKGAMDSYDASFKQPPAQTNVFNIGIGNSASGGGGR
jgi:hypothetical protein